MRQLASIQEILDIQPIEGADNIEKVRINGWWVVVPKVTNYKTGDLVVYFEIDSMLPTLDGKTPFQFLIDKSSRKKVLDNGETVLVHVLKTIRLRGTYSQGFVLPLTELLTIEKNVLTSKLSTKNSIASVEKVYFETLVGTDITDLLGIEKYEKPLPACLSGMARGNFPSFLVKTDQERCQNLVNENQLFTRIANGEKWEVSEKLDGSSETIYFVLDEEQPENAVLQQGRMGVCSRNLDLKETVDNSFWQVARQHFPADGMGVLHIDSIARHSPMAFQGELMGNGVQGNSLALSGHKLFVFNVYDIENKSYLPPVLAREKTEQMGMSYVPVIDKAFVLPVEYSDPSKASELVDYLLAMAEGKMMLNKNKNREGLVFKSEDGQFSFKAISNSWLLKNE